MRPASTLTPKRIVAIALRDGVFEVSWRWQDDQLRARCNKLVKAGLLKRKRGCHGADYFTAQPTPAHSDEVQND